MDPSKRVEFFLPLRNENNLMKRQIERDVGEWNEKKICGVDLDTSLTNPQLSFEEGDCHFCRTYRIDESRNFENESIVRRKYNQVSAS